MRWSSTPHCRLPSGATGTLRSSVVGGGDAFSVRPARLGVHLERRSPPLRCAYFSRPVQSDATTAIRSSNSQQLEVVEGFGHVVVRAEVERPDLVQPAAARSQHEDRSARRTSLGCADRPPDHRGVVWPRPGYPSGGGHGARGAVASAYRRVLMRPLPYDRQRSAGRQLLRCCLCGSVRSRSAAATASSTLTSSVLRPCGPRRATARGLKGP